MKRKTASDYILTYVCEILILLAGEWYIMQDYYTRHGAMSLPFCVGMLLTAVVAGVGMHYALTKLSKKLVYGGYGVWLVETGLILLSAGVIWTANSRIEDHEKAMKLAQEKAAAEKKSETEAKTTDAQTGLAVTLAKLQAVQPLLEKAKNTKERQAILKLAGAEAAPTPVPIGEQVTAAIVKPEPPKKDQKDKIEEFKPFAEGSFFAWWYEDVIRFTGLFGLAGMALLFFLFLKYQDEENALLHIQTGSTTTTVVETNAAYHNAPAAGFAAAVTPQSAPRPATHNTTFNNGGTPGNR